MISCYIRLRYGPVYKILVGGRRITVVSSPDTIANFFRDQTGALHTGKQILQIFRAVGDINIGHEYLHEVTDGMLFPVISDCLSKNNLEIFTSDFAKHFLRFMEPFSTSTSTTLPLVHLVSEGMYKAASLAIFGPLFPTDSHRDFTFVDGNIHMLLLPVPFFGAAAKRARRRLLSQVGEYIKNGWRSEEDGHIEGASELASRCVRILKRCSLSHDNVAATFLAFMWGIHSMSMRSSFWVVAHLLTHENALKSVREEVDNVIAATEGGLHTLFNSPYALDAMHLPLLDSAVKETMRHITVMGGMREAMADVEIRGADQTYIIRKGELISAYLGAQNHNENEFCDPYAYKFDRFAGDSGKRLHSLVRMNWGGGRHLVLFQSF